VIAAVAALSRLGDNRQNHASDLPEAGHDATPGERRSDARFTSRLDDSVMSRDDDPEGRDVTETGRFIDGDRERPPEPPSRTADPDASHAETSEREDGERHSQPGRTFADGAVIAGRYRVVKFLAQGGMGEVYEVEDRELGERVAMTTILPRIAAHPVPLERFRREILFARRITHPNVCRIFDIGHHALSVQPGDEVTFLTMELLEGESLSKHQRRHGPMSTADALPLVQQITSGLAAAHRAGVVHRDLKPANIFLVPGDGGPRAVVTDFGLARIEAAGEALKEVTGTGELLGTPSYMSPEQLEGGTPTPASDIYALGLIIYEMLTGARAFEGDTAFQMALKRLQQPPIAPSKHIPGIDPLWERTILHCLEKDPADRFANVEEIGRVLEGELPAPSGMSWRRWRGELRAALRNPTFWIPVIVIATAVAVVAVRGRRIVPESTVGDRRSVAVLGFDNVSNDPDASWMSTALSEILTTDLAAGGGLRTIPGETVVRVRTDLGIPQMHSLGEDTLTRLRENLGTDLVVLGSFTATQDRLRLDVRVQDAATGELVVQQPESGARDDFFELAEAAASAIRSSLGVATATEAASAMASLVTNPTAARLYAEGLERLRSFDSLGAKDLLVRAAEEDPESPLIRLALAEAWRDLGYQQEALTAAETAYKLSENLGREERTRIRGEYMMAARQWEEAVESFRSLWTFFPDNLGYGLSLAGAQLAAGQAEAALDTVGGLRSLPSPDSEDPRVDLEEAAALSALGRFDEQLAAARRAVEESRQRSARLVLAEARLEEASALISLGRYDEAAGACEEALAIFTQAQNRTGEAAALERMALTAYYRGDFRTAEERLETALEISRRVGNREGEANNLNLLGAMQLERGRLGEAEESFAQVLSIANEIASGEGEALALNNLALVHQRRGDVAGAIDRFQQALVLERERGSRDGEARALENIAGSYAADGDLARAREFYEQAMGVYRRLESPSDLARVLYWLGEVQLWRGDLTDARNRHSEALELRRSAGEDAASAHSSAALAGITLQAAHLGQARYEEAADAFATAEEEFSRLDWTEEQSRALSSLAEAELGRGRLDRAASALERALESGGEVDEITARLAVRISRARVLARQGASEAALAAAMEAVADAESSPILGLQYEARLALGEVELAVGRLAEGEQRLRRLRREAEARGWFLVSERVDAILESSR
jgi:tetratricopeptide (TPR) repeat protein